MPIHRTGGTILSLAAQALKHAAMKGQEAARSGRSRYAQAAAPDQPSATKAAGSTSDPGGHDKTMQGRLRFPPMTATGFLSTKPGAARVARTLVGSSLPAAAAYATQSAVEPPPASVKQLRELIKAGKTEGLNQAAAEKLLSQAADLSPGDADHLSAKDKADIISLAGYDAILLRFDDELLPMLGAASKANPELGPAGLERDFERAQQTIIDGFDAEGVMPELRNWGTPHRGDLQTTMQRVANTVGEAFNLQDPPKSKIDDSLQQDARFDPDEPSVLRVSARLVDDGNSVQMVRAIVHETTHAAQYALVDRLGGPDRTASGPYRDNALLLRASMDYVKLKISPRMNDHDHPDYRHLWVERQAFDMGDGVARHLADRIGVDYVQEGDVFSLDRRALARPA